MTDYSGIVLDLPEDEYHAHPALSSTGARQLLDSPARFRYAQTHPQKAKKEFDLGTAAHALVLGTGAETVAIPEELLASNGAISTKAAKDWVAEARENGQTPVKQEVLESVQAMAEATLAHPHARSLLEQEGEAEASVFAIDPETGVPMRARFDYLAAHTVDLKSTGKEASASAFAKTVANFGYNVQRSHYLDTLEIVTGERREMLFVVVEAAPPHLVAVYRLDRDFTDMGDVKAKRAREIYARSLATGEWPGYPTDIGLLSPPMYSVYDFQDNYS